MGAEEALDFVDKLVFVETGEHLDQPQRVIFCQLWRDNKLRYQDISESCGYSDAYLREVGAELWQILSEVLKEKVVKGTFQAAVERLWRMQPATIPVMSPQVTVVDSDFLGRDREIAELNNIITRGAKVILLQAEGGVGKTTLARKYFKTQGFDFVLELWMPYERQNLTPVESVVEEWLRRDFNEEPGRDFGINLERLRRKLREKNRKIGVFIDNLESALDRNGKFIDTRRLYVELLRVLADSAVNSVTLVTSRERLFESSLEIEFYPLEGLDEEIWRQFFTSRKINSNSSVLSEMCSSYGGNAKAMQILSGAISIDFNGDIDAYWQENSSDLLNDRQLKDLVTTQFNRLEENNLEAYRLLCRLGCYRYQDITSVPIEGVLCLLWDVTVSQPRRVIRALQEFSLIEAKKGQYWLHPVIRSEAIARLKSSSEWGLVNKKAAEYWTQSVDIIKNITDASMALEAYYHYVEIADFEQAGNVILHTRGNEDKVPLPLGCSFYHLGLLQKIISVITQIINNISCNEARSRLSNILGYSYRIVGNIKAALECHEASRKIVEEFDLTQLKISPLLNIGLCKMELWEIEEAKDLFNCVCLLVEPTRTNLEYIVYCECNLAYINSCLQLREDAATLAANAENRMLNIKMTAWGTGYSLLFLGLTYKNLGNIKKSLELCQRAISFSEENSFTQVKAKAISCLAELYREQDGFEKALFHHTEAIEILNRLGAKCDLAEAYYQLALTYQKMGQFHQSQKHFTQAIALFNEMQAPRQVEKVQTAMECFQK
jgi:tetratricopeptide (TPR) repeat protein